MIEANRWKLGLFIVIGMACLLGGILIFGVSQFLVPKVKVMTIFFESVNGLEVGSSVKYSGVPVGTVTDIKIEPGGAISVYMDLFPDVMDVKTREEIHSLLKGGVTERKIINNFVQRGFKCTLQLAGISGNMYIGIDRYRSEDVPYSIDPVLKEIIGDKLYFPSVPSYISGLADNVSKLLNQIADTNFKEISSNLKGSFTTVQSLLVKINTLLTSLESQELGRILLQTTSKLDETLDAATELCNQISEQPNSVLRGNETKPIFPTK